MLCEAMQRIPGNRDFEQRYEFASVVRHYCGQRAYLLFQALYTITLQTTNVAAGIISAQVVDSYIAEVAGESLAIEWTSGKVARYTNALLGPHNATDTGGYWCLGDVDASTGLCSGPETSLVLSLGYLVCMVICIPFGFLNLDENMSAASIPLARHLCRDHPYPGP